MKADKLIKNAKIFTADKDNPKATALAVKDGKFVYVGDEAGLSEYEGEVTDLGGKFIMPDILDTHVHVTTSIAFEYADLGVRFECEGKQAALDFMKDYISQNPGLTRYRFLLEKKCLNGEEIVKEDLDAICPDSELIILEGECHSVWVNSKVLEANNITDDIVDPVPGLSYFVRKDGHITGNAFESAAWPFLFDSLSSLSDEQIEGPLLRFIDYCVNTGVSCVFDAGFPEHEAMHERIYLQLKKMDLEGRLPVYIDGCYMLTNPAKTEKALEELKRFNREFDTEHLKVHTLKILMDGTQKIHTAAMVTPYVDTGELGSTTFDAEGLAEVIKSLNEMGMDLHIHTVGERSSRTALDGVELARKELGDDFRVRVTCAHIEIQDDADVGRFAELGVIANFTPYWHSGDPASTATWLGDERARKMFRCKSVWDSGALVTWSSDNVAYADFVTWSPFLGMEVGMRRQITDKSRAHEYLVSAKALEPVDEKMGIEEMLLGYTINGAIQLGIEDAKGSIEAGKDADFLVFDNDLLTAEQEGFSHNIPSDVYICGKKVK
ncbi:MAG: amidohydrolase family protein [Parasporobacterium sp.]|nr:amidohydrolase family protein [Parasporobacterium sp.]